MKRDRRAIAGLFDALIFLAIASLVSVSLLSALGGPASADDEMQKKVDAAHRVLLRTTVDDPRGNPTPIEEMFKIDSVEGMECGKNITMVLDLLLPGTEWRWSAEKGDRSWAFGNESVPGGTIYCSIIRAPFNGSVVEYRLDVWIPYS
jgi:hypothetical protein